MHFNIYWAPVICKLLGAGIPGMGTTFSCPWRNHMSVGKQIVTKNLLNDCKLGDLKSQCPLLLSEFPTSENCWWEPSFAAAALLHLSVCPCGRCSRCKGSGELPIVFTHQREE